MTSPQKKTRRRPRNPSFGRREIQRLRRALGDFRWMIIMQWVHRRRELLTALDREAVILYELWLTLPDDAEKQFRASIRRLKKEFDRCYLFPIH